METDSEEYNSQNDTDLDLEEQDGNAGLEHEEQDRTVLLKESPDLQVSGLAPCWLQLWSWVHLQTLGWKDVLQSFFSWLQERCLGLLGLL